MKKVLCLVICNIDDVMNYLKYFVKDSLYITNERIYIYSESKKNDLTNIEKKYRRYINDVVNGDEYIIINTINYKRNIFKNLWYYIVDTFTSIYDFIGNILKLPQVTFVKSGQYSVHPFIYKFLTEFMAVGC